MTSAQGRALVTGVSGYIGGQLVQPLLDEGWSVRALTRSADKLKDEPWRESIEVVEGDATAARDLDEALADVDVAYYLLHSMDSSGDFERRDRELAQTFAAAAERAGVSRIVYLGGLHPDGDPQKLSPHLRSRVEVGQVFLDCDVPATCLQAGIVLGAGSASFQMLHALAERLPLMIAPKWLRNRIQPISVDDAVYYLVGSASMPSEVNRTFDIGGPDVLTYTQMIHRYTKVAGNMRRVIIPVPVFTPTLASYWVGFVTPVDAGLARPLVGSLIHECVCSEKDIEDYIPDPPGGRVSFDEAVEEALADMSD
ncbi:MAG: NAD(P)H-binding protein [Mobilicoccus sp.]|nr:NAD(P)H-binding protein [Mobilicoccus sp.]